MRKIIGLFLLFLFVGKVHCEPVIEKDIDETKDMNLEEPLFKKDIDETEYMNLEAVAGEADSHRFILVGIYQRLDPIQQFGNYSRVGLSLLLTDDERQDNDYFNLEISIGLKYGKRISYYGGVGAILGENEQCEKNENGIEECSSEYDTGFYPEAGISFSLGENLYFAVIFRKYFFSDTDDFRAVGITFGGKM